MIVYLFFLHFIADFILQSREMGKKKSQELKWLLAHLYIQYGVFLFGLYPFFGPKSLLISLSNCLVHGVIDWNIWKLYKLSVIKRYPKADESFKYYDDHWFYTTIGFDQFLHMTTLALLLRFFT